MDLSNLPQTRAQLEETEKKLNHTRNTNDPKYVKFIWARWCVAMRNREFHIRQMYRRIAKLTPRVAYNYIIFNFCDRCHFRTAEFINWSTPGFFCGHCTPLDDTVFFVP